MVLIFLVEKYITKKKKIVYKMLVFSGTIMLFFFLIYFNTYTNR